MSQELFEALSAAVPTGTTIPTLSREAPNVVVEITPEAVMIETHRSSQRDDGPQPVAGWMLQSAWDRLSEQGDLTNQELQASDDLNVKRSSAVCALLAMLPDVEVVSTSPIRLELVR